MSTSAQSARIALGSGELVDTDGMATGLLRAVANNGRHFADEAAQVRVAWAARTGDYLTTKAIAAADTGTYFPIAVFGPFPVQLVELGTPYLMRARIHGAASAANSVTFRAALAPIKGRVTGDGLDFVRDQIADNGINVLEASTSSTTAVWLTATGSRTTLDANTLIDESVQSLHIDTSAVADAGSSVDVTMMAVHVWASSTAEGTQPYLTGFYAAEYVGT